MNLRSGFYLTPWPRVAQQVEARQGLGLGAMWGRGAVVQKYIYFLGVWMGRFVITVDNLIRLRVQVQK